MRERINHRQAGISSMNPLKNERGGSLIEFVLIAWVLFLILFGIMEFGLIMYNQAVITNASREGARYGIVSRTPRYTEEQIVTYVSQCVCRQTHNVWNPFIRCNLRRPSLPYLWRGFDR